MRKQIADRLFLATLSYAAIGVAIWEPSTLSYVLVHTGGWPARVSIAALFVFTTVALADTIVNDCLSDRFSLHTAVQYRQAIWLLIAITYAGHASVILRTNSGYGVALVYVLYALRCAAVSFLDLTYRFQDRLAQVTGDAVKTDHGVLDA